MGKELFELWLAFVVGNFLYLYLDAKHKKTPFNKSKFFERCWFQGLVLFAAYWLLIR